MKIICTKEEFAEMITHCAENVQIDSRRCDGCAIYDRCQGAYIDTLTKIIEVINDEQS